MTTMATNRRRLRSRSTHGTSALVLFIAALLILIPFLWMVSLAFTPNEDAFGAVGLIPDHPTTENFRYILTESNVPRALLNSTLIALAVVATNCTVSILAGYGFAKLPFRASKPLFVTIIATTAIPGSVTLIPLFLMVRSVPLLGGNDASGAGGVGLLDSLAGVALPSLVLPLNIFLSRQYFLSSDASLAEAARIDGASEFAIFRRIYFPIAKPLVATIAIFSFTATWDDFLWPLVIISSEHNQTVQLALARFLSTGNVQYGPIMAGAVLITLPVLAVFLFNQKRFIAGLAEGSVKG